MPLGSAGIEVQGTAGPTSDARKLVRTRSSWKPTLNGLQLASPVLNGPAAVSFIPSGKNGRCRKPLARSVKAKAPSNLSPSAAARSTYEPNPAARKAVAAFAPETNAAVRAFWTATSKPKTGASCCLKTPSTTPAVSTTAIVTRALLPSGCRIAARVMFACCAACVMMVLTSVDVSELLAGAVPAVNGKNRVSTSPAIPPTTCGTNAEAGGDVMVAPAMMAIVVDVG